VLVIDIDGTADHKSAAKYIEDLGFEDIADSKGKQSEQQHNLRLVVGGLTLTLAESNTECKAESKLDAAEKDLLDLMDEASLK
jgi:hypothetical protein